MGLTPGTHLITFDAEVDAKGKVKFSTVNETTLKPQAPLLYLSLDLFTSIAPYQRPAK